MKAKLKNPDSHTFDFIQWHDLDVNYETECEVVKWLLKNRIRFLFKYDSEASYKNPLLLVDIDLKKVQCLDHIVKYHDNVLVLNLEAFKAMFEVIDES